MPNVVGNPGNETIAAAIGVARLLLRRYLLPSLSALCVFGVNCAFALNPVYLVKQYGHTASTIRDGDIPGIPTAITQTNDGYIWLGTSAGLLRFDGVRFTPWTSLSHSPLLSSDIAALLPDRDGGLWVGTENGGLDHLEGTTAVSVASETGGLGVWNLFQDNDGSIWVLRHQKTRDPRLLCRISAGRRSCFGAESGLTGYPGGFHSLAQDRAGNLWLGSDTSLIRWKDGTAQSFPVHGLESHVGDLGVAALLSEPDGSLLVGIAQSGAGLGLQRFAEGKLTSITAPDFNGSRLSVDALLRDRDGGLWVGTLDNGIYRIYKDRVDHFTAADGLSDDKVYALFEDREGTILVVTGKGLDRFRDTPVVSFWDQEDFRATEVDGVFVSSNGTLWVSGNGAFYSLKAGATRFVAQLGNQPGKQITTIFEDHVGRMWVGVNDTMNIMDHERLEPVNRADGRPVGMILSMAEDRGGVIWALSLGRPRAILQMDPVKDTAFAVLSLPEASRIAADPRGGFWLGLLDGGIARYQNGTVETFRAKSQSVTSRVKQLVVASDGTVYATTGFGLLVWKDRRIALMNAQNGLPCSDVGTTILDATGDLWLYMSCGLIRLDHNDLQRWWRDPATAVKATVFDAQDGALGYSPAFAGAARTPDGRLWFANTNALQMIDPAHLRKNQVRPPVHILSVVADRRGYPVTAGVTFPPLTRDLEIDYTALSFVAPQKVMFRYKLEGYDKSWHDVGPRREAFYTNLPPAKYRFRVIASNNDGVWNEVGDELDLNIRPAFYQTLAFQLTCLAVIIATLWFLFRLRMRYVAARTELLVAARHAERERIARQLHDTFLQSMQGLIMHFAGATARIASSHPVRADLEELLDRSRGVIAEARDSIQDLRTTALSTLELTQSLASIGTELQGTTSAELTVTTTGKPRMLYVTVYEELYRIGREAILNAAKHSSARRIEVDITYSDTQLRMLIRDDGQGIAADVLQQGKEGHWGLRGMRERAAAIAGQIEIRSERNAGTEVEVVIPAVKAYGSDTTVSVWTGRRRSLS
jgi:signal transduction histidine kinase/ligand-binding sensor domain-containing protein